MNLFTKHKERIARSLPKTSQNGSLKPAKSLEDAVLETCPGCHAVIPLQSLAGNAWLCPGCGHHFPLSARERIRQLCDPFTFRETNADCTTKNVHHFPGYDQKLNQAGSSTGMKEAVITGTAKIHGILLALAVMDSHFMMGSMSALVGEKITRLIETALQTRLPLLLVCTSGGARMQEGMYALMQMAKTSSALKAYANAGCLCITLLTHPTTGGVSASFAMLGDVILAEPDALIGFAGRRVIEKTIGERLPEEFQRAEFVLEHGFLDAIVERRDLKRYISHLLKLHGYEPEGGGKG